MNKVLTITIGIPAYNEEKTLAPLIQSLLDQDKEAFIVNSIIVVDSGNDSTTSTLTSFPPSVLQYQKKLKRQSKIVSLNEIRSLVRPDTDVVVFFDADITVPNRSFLATVAHSYTHRKWDLMCVRTTPQQPVNFFQSLLMSSRTLLNHILTTTTNALCCDGKCMAFSKQFLNEFKWPEEISADDMYAYFYALERKKSFFYDKSVEVFYTLPMNFKDQRKQTVRFVQSKKRHGKGVWQHNSEGGI